jgi:hypothetical protein
MTGREAVAIGDGFQLLIAASSNVVLIVRYDNDTGGGTWITNGTDLLFDGLAHVCAATIIGSITNDGN